MAFKPRPGQIEIARYSGGLMGISAVPGSGKTHTLAYLAANLIAHEEFDEGQEILIVTLVNSAVENISSRIAHFLSEMHLIPGVGYRVRTLHGLAYDIVRENPDLIGLDNHFSIADERTSGDILNMAVQKWLRSNPAFLEAYSHPNYPPDRHRRDWLELLTNVSMNFIKKAKDYRISPDDLELGISDTRNKNPLLIMGYEVYSDYQRSLTIRGSVDFEDLIRFAYRVLKNSRDYLDIIRQRWPIVLEDEAQDSSLIQQELLELICGEIGNWVRVGDPNQAIYETFTTADPELLRSFISRDDVIRHDLVHSGRSAKSIIDLANFLIEWSKTAHPESEIRGTLDDPFIQPTPKGDPQQNPPDEESFIYLWDEPLSPRREIEVVATSVRDWLEDHPDRTAAVLVPRNDRGAEMVQALELLGLSPIEHLKSTQSVRNIAGTLEDILGFLTNPLAITDLLFAIKSIISVSQEDDELDDDVNLILDFLVKNISPEELVSNKHINLEASGAGDSANQVFLNALNHLRRWQYTVNLPIDQMILSISLDLFRDASELAVAHKLALLLKSSHDLNPAFELSDFRNNLEMISKNRFRLYGFSEEDFGFNPDDYRGKVVVSTMHKAKGLEWDRVYLMSVNNFNFPSCQEYDRYYSEKYFVKENLNLEAELISKLDAMAVEDKTGFQMPEGTATRDARIEFCAERLRLLFVGVTRARRELVITWNTGKRNDCREAIPLQAMRKWWEDGNAAG